MFDCAQNACAHTAKTPNPPRLPRTLTLSLPRGVLNATQTPGKQPRHHPNAQKTLDTTQSPQSPPAYYQDTLKTNSTIPKSSKFQSTVHNTQTPTFSKRSTSSAASLPPSPVWRPRGLRPSRCPGAAPRQARTHVIEGVARRCV